MRECLCYPLPLHTLPSVAFHFHYTLSFPVCFAGIEFSSLAAWDWCFWIYPSFHVYILSHCALSGGTPESDCTCQGWKQSTIYKGTVSCYCLAVVRWRNKQAVPFFFCCLFSRPCNTEELCFVSCHSQKNTDVKQKVLWLMADQRRQRWKKSCRVHLRSQPLFLVPPGVHDSACLQGQSCPSGSSLPKTLLNVVQPEQVCL